MRIAIILAAGKGERMGGSKALLMLEGEAEPLVLLHARRAAQVGCAPVIVVVQPEVLPLVRGKGTALASREPDRSGSLAIAIHHLAAVPSAEVLVTPVDALPVVPETARALFAALAGYEAVTPTYEGRGGHPIVCTLQALRGIGAGESLRDALRALGERRRRLEVEDPHVRVDLDSPHDYRQFNRCEPFFFPIQ